MPFERPSLQELIARIQADMDSRLDGQPWLRRRLLAILARMEGGVAHGLYGLSGLAGPADHAGYG